MNRSWKWRGGAGGGSISGKGQQVQRPGGKKSAWHVQGQKGDYCGRSSTVKEKEWWLGGVDRARRNHFVRFEAGEKQDKAWNNWLTFRYLPGSLTQACWEQLKGLMSKEHYSLQASVQVEWTLFPQIFLDRGSKVSGRIKRLECASANC